MHAHTFLKVRRLYVLIEHKNAIITTSWHRLCKDMAEVHSGESWSIAMKYVKNKPHYWKIMKKVLQQGLSSPLKYIIRLVVYSTYTTFTTNSYIEITFVSNIIII